MAITYPTTLDNFTNPTSTDTMDSVTVPHATQHANLNDAVEALEAKVGINSSAVTTSLDYKVTTLETNYISKTTVDAKGDLLAGTADNTITRLASSAVDGQVLTVDTSTATGLKWAAAGGVSFDSDQNILAIAVFA